MDYGHQPPFSQPAMVAGPLRGFVHEDWEAEPDFAALEKVNGGYIADGFRERGGVGFSPLRCRRMFSRTGRPLNSNSADSTKSR